LTNSKSHSLQTSKIEYIDDLPEYPTSHIHGYSYVVASRGRSQSEMEQLVHEVALNTLYLLLKYLLIDYRSLRKIYKILETDVGKRNAYSYYRSKREFFNKGYACVDQLPTCKPVFKWHTEMNVHGEYPPYIGCSNGSNEFLTKHHRGSIQGHTSLDIQFLEDIFNHNIMPATEECGVFESLASRRKYCVDINECPYILFTSHGIHQHPPPPPSKAPERILQGVKRIIQQIQDPSLTTAQFLRNPQLEAFCQQYNASTLAEIHSSFCNKD
ncbi:uncharacterized protein ASPGLDRAFT_1510767, partial [Aspergillus glaucus CBS 516.65]